MFARRAVDNGSGAASHRSAPAKNNAEVDVELGDAVDANGQERGGAGEHDQPFVIVEELKHDDLQTLTWQATSRTADPAW